MKKILIFLGGLFTGVILVIMITYVYFNSNNRPEKDITWFDNPSEIIKVKSFSVFQVLDDHAALVQGEIPLFGPVYLLVNNEGKYYYDNENIEVPKGKVARQVGIYRYKTTEDKQKTVPVVRIMER